MDEKRTQDDQGHEPGHAPGAVRHPESTAGQDAASGAAGDAASDESVPTGGNAAQAAAVFGVHNEPPAEMDSGGAG